MTTREIRFDQAVVRAFVGFSRIAAWLVIAVALTVFLAWAADSALLGRLAAAGVTMHAGAAIGCLLAAAALLLAGRAPRASFTLSLILLLLAVAELLHHLTGFGHAAWDGLDRLFPALHHKPWGRITDLAAVLLALLGAAGLVMGRPRFLWLREALLLAALGLSLASTASFGLMLGGEPAGLLASLPLLTAFAGIALALAWMSSLPTTGLTRITVTASPGGAFARRLILPSLLLPVLLALAFKGVQVWFGMPASIALALGTTATGGAVASMILWVAALLDRSERARRLAAALREDAGTDALTGLANRRAFDASLLRMGSERRGDGFALLMLDLDRFKSYNDDFGHLAGDEVLRITGRLLRARVRPQDLAARYGGEEFALLLVDADAAHAAAVAERVLVAFRRHDWPLRRVTISIGGALARETDSPEDLVQRADAALYASKAAGRDRYTAAVA